MKTIPLTQGKVALVDDEDYEFLSQWKWYAKRVRGNLWYASRAEYLSTGKLRFFYMHRVLCPGREIDHRDGNSVNNQKENLRSVSHSLNIFNSKRVGKSGIRGVQRRGNYWYAQISCKGKWYNLGFHSNLEDAKEARRRAEIKFFGETIMNKNTKQRKAANPGAHAPRKSTKPKVGASAAEITRRIAKERS